MLAGLLYRPAERICTGADERIADAWSQDHRDRVRAARPGWELVCQCNQFTATATPERCDALLLERVGHTLNPPVEVWRNVWADATGRPFLRQEDTLASRRRLFAAMALLADGVFAQGGDPNRTPSLALRDPEHWELDLGPPESARRPVAPGVYERAFARGVVVVNVGERAYRYRGSDGKRRTIPPHDALVAQTRDERGPLARWLTTSGR